MTPPAPRRPFPAPARRSPPGIITVWVLLAAATSVLPSACFALDLPDVERTRIDRSNHAFPVSAGAHGTADCDDCHGEFETFTLFTCISCHEHAEVEITPHHTGVEGFSYGPQTCYECHPTGAVDGIDRAAHDVYFPIEMGPHATAACASCHVYDGRDRFSCIGCHEHELAPMTTAHTQVADFVHADTSCYDCHPRGEVIDRASHGTLFPILGGNHGEVTCDECHGATFSELACVECHEHTCTEMNDKHDEVSGYRCRSDECFACHPQGRGDGD